MSKIEIEKSELLSRYHAASKEMQKEMESIFGKEVFSSKITDRIKSYEDACKELGIVPMTVSDFNRPRLIDGSYANKTALNAILSPAASFAQHKMEVIIAALNEGWIADYSNHDQKKYYPCFYTDKKGGFSYNTYNYLCNCSTVGSRLVLKSEELAIYAGNEFLPIYKEFIVIEKQ